MDNTKSMPKNPFPNHNAPATPAGPPGYDQLMMLQKQQIKLECLKLAASKEPGSNAILVADQYYNWITS